MKRFIATALFIVCLFAMTGCEKKQGDMGITMDDFISSYNQAAKDKGIEQAAFEDYTQGVLPEGGILSYIFDKGAKLTLMVDKELNVSIASITAHPGLLKDEASIQEFREAAINCIDILDKQYRDEIMQATGLNDLKNAMDKAVADKNKNKLYFFDTNTKQKDPVHGKTYQLVYTDYQGKLYFDISYPMKTS